MSGIDGASESLSVQDETAGVGKMFAGPAGGDRHEIGYITDEQLLGSFNQPANGRAKTTEAARNTLAATQRVVAWQHGQPVRIHRRWPRVVTFTGLYTPCATCRMPLVEPLPDGWTIVVENPTALGLPTHITPHRADCPQVQR